MTIAKLFMNGRSQAVRLRKEFRFEGEEEVMIKRMGDVVMLIPKNKWQDIIVGALQTFPKDVAFDRQIRQGVADFVRTTFDITTPRLAL
jgi:antitoxin VapB